MNDQNDDKASDMPMADATDAALEAAQAALNSPSAADVPVMVLLVDDQAIVVEAVRRALMNEKGIDFHYCMNSSEALDAAIRTRPTVILQDLVMPGIDGLTLVKSYRSDPAMQDTPIIVLSTKDEPVIKSAAFAVGANDYLVKLPDRIELVARLRYHSRSFVNLMQRDEAYRALRRSQRQLIETNLELQRLTNVDGLTSLSNRRYLDEYLSAEWRRCGREQTELSFLMIDVDNFKAYNDNYGHVSGDDVLKRVAASLEGCIDRAGDLAARFGGEEFAVVLPGTSIDGARAIAEKIRQRIEALQIPHEFSSEASCVTASIGGACIVPTEDGKITSLIEAADQALYRAKHNGKNCVILD